MSAKPILSGLVVVWFGLLGGTNSIWAQPHSIDNPYFMVREWKVWSIDDTSEAPQELKFVSPGKRLFPAEDGSLSYDTQPNSRAGWWDDVYVSQDNFHSRIRPTWTGSDGQMISIRNQFPVLKRGYFKFTVNGTQVRSPASAELKQLGASYVSQSTNGMGHDIANNPLRVLIHEREFYFSGIIRAAPAHTSFREQRSQLTEDAYGALVPSMFNSIGSSGSETWALTKMCIAASYLPTELKREMKRHGVFPASMLYLWKAALPYSAPFSSEHRHKVAYLSDGADAEGLGSLQAPVQLAVHQYDDTRHLKNMVELASNLKYAPPVAILSDVQLESGKPVYALRTAALIEQRAEEVVVSFAADQSYDIQGLPVKMRAVCICGSPEVSIEETQANRFQATIPFNASLPAGRTTILVIPSNGYSEGNPVAINVYRQGSQPNQRPVIEMPGRVIVGPGRIARVKLRARDPEGLPVHFTKLSDSLGKIENDELVWNCPVDQPTGRYPVTVIASDRCSGGSYTAFELPIHVQSTVADVQTQLAGESRQSVADIDKSIATVVSGPVPLEVTFDSSRSGDLSGSQLQRQWTIGDVAKPDVTSFTHTFEQPGVYRVTLQVDGESGTDQASRFVHAEHDWPVRLADGWSPKGISSAWKRNSSKMSASVAGFNGKHALQMAVASRSTDRKALSLRDQFHPPFCVEVDFLRNRNMRGTGIDILGCVFGRPPLEDGTFAQDLSLVAHRGGTQARRQFAAEICKFPAKLPEPARLRVYVLARGKSQCDLSGFVAFDDQVHWFAFDNCLQTHDQIACLAGELGTEFITRFRLWSPELN